MAASRKQATVKSGFTLVELLVVISIIAILMGLLIPAVNAARETARRNECSSRMNNLAKASIQYVMSHKGFPGWCNDFGTYKNSGTVDPSQPEANLTAVNHKKLGSWVVGLLPQLDAQAAYEAWTQDKYPIIVSDGTDTKFTDTTAPNLPIMQCPSSTTITATQGKNSFVANTGMYNLDSHVVSGANISRSTANVQTPPTGSGTDVIDFDRAQRKANGVFNYKYAANLGSVAVGPSLNIEDLKDGAGNTAIFSENLQAVAWNQLHPDTASSMTLVIPLGSATQVGFDRYGQLTQGMVWHYRDKKGANPAFNGSSTVDATSPYAIPQINEGIGSSDIFILEMDTSNADQLARPSSAHVDGVNMGFADGSTRYVLQSIDYRVYQALLTPRGKSSDVPLREFVPPADSI